MNLVSLLLQALLLLGLSREELRMFFLLPCFGVLLAHPVVMIAVIRDKPSRPERLRLLSNSAPLQKSGQKLGALRAVRVSIDG